MHKRVLNFYFYGKLFFITFPGTSEVLTFAHYFSELFLNWFGFYPVSIYEYSWSLAPLISWTPLIGIKDHPRAVRSQTWLSAWSCAFYIFFFSADPWRISCPFWGGWYIYTLLCFRCHFSESVKEREAHFISRNINHCLQIQVEIKGEKVNEAKGI